MIWIPSLTNSSLTIHSYTLQFPSVSLIMTNTEWFTTRKLASRMRTARLSTVHGPTGPCRRRSNSSWVIGPPPSVADIWWLVVRSNASWVMVTTENITFLKLHQLTPIDSKCWIQHQPLWLMLWFQGFLFLVRFLSTYGLGFVSPSRLGFYISPWTRFLYPYALGFLIYLWTRFYYPRALGFYALPD